MDDFTKNIEMENGRGISPLIVQSLEEGGGEGESLQGKNLRRRQRSSSQKQGEEKSMRFMEVKGRECLQKSEYPSMINAVEMVKIINLLGHIDR